jgi:hypothetical protein
MAMEEDIKKRLRESADACLSSYEAWNGNKKNSEAREALLEAVHEIRKVASRVEIELAISERDEMAQKPIPIPPHRDAQRRSLENDDFGNVSEPMTHQGGGHREGGGHRDGGHRRRSPRQRSENRGN